MAFETSKQSNLLSQLSMGSPEAYLMDSLSSIFLNRRPERLKKKSAITYIHLCKGLLGITVWISLD